MNYQRLIKRAVKYPEQLTQDEKQALYMLKIGTERLLREHPNKEQDPVFKLLVDLFGLGGKDGK